MKKGQILFTAVSGLVLAGWALPASAQYHSRYGQQRQYEQQFEMRAQRDYARREHQRQLDVMEDRRNYADRKHQYQLDVMRSRRERAWGGGYNDRGW